MAANLVVTASKKSAPFSEVADLGSPTPVSAEILDHGLSAYSQPSRIAAILLFRS